jgi:hypothetical protein
MNEVHRPDVLQRQWWEYNPVEISRRGLYVQKHKFLKKKKKGEEISGYVQSCVKSRRDVL